MRKFTILIAALALSWGVLAQNQQFTKANESDPKAKAILDKVRKKYDGYKSLEVAFTLEIELPEQPKETQKGKIARQGDKYRVDLSSQSILSDGKAVWLIMNSNKEVQINNMPEEGEEDDILSPQSLFNFYNKGKFVYALVNEYAEGGKVLQQIEFKPLDKTYDYSKIRMTINKNTNEVLMVKAFGKDSSRYTFSINQLSSNKTFAANYFTFDKSKYPGYHIEDLRD